MSKHLSFILAAVYLLPLALPAQQDEVTTKPSTAEALLWSLLPLVIIAVLVLIFFRFAQRKHQPHVLRHVQHMERVEESLERIARALEKKDRDAG